MSPSVHIVTGATGAGKTYYAHALTEEIRGVRFSIDEWMGALFWMDCPTPIDFAWTMARIDRCEALIGEQLGQLVRTGTPAVLDLGFTLAGHRARFARLAQAMGAAVRLHWLDIAAPTRWQRVQARNRQQGETYVMTVDRDMFDFMEQRWEPPSGAEMASLDGLRLAD